nr:MAG TPA: hypothetical protein [Caudoviricetes sp.]
MGRGYSPIAACRNKGQIFHLDCLYLKVPTV